MVNVMAAYQPVCKRAVPECTETCRSNCGNFNCFNIPVIFKLCASVGLIKKCFDTVTSHFECFLQE